MKGMYQVSSGLTPQRSLLNVYNYHGFGLVLYTFGMIDHSKQILNCKRSTLIFNNNIYKTGCTSHDCGSYRLI